MADYMRILDAEEADCRQGHISLISKFDTWTDDLGRSRLAASSYLVMGDAELCAAPSDSALSIDAVDQVRAALCKIEDAIFESRDVTDGAKLRLVGVVWEIGFRLVDDLQGDVR